MKVALIFSNYGPYHLARIEALATQSQKKGWEVIGIELARSETEYPWEIELEDLPTKVYSVFSHQTLEQVSFVRLIHRYYQLLVQLNPDVLAIAGYGRPAMLATLMWSIWHRKIAILLSDTKQDDASRRRWQETLKGWIVNQYSSALVAGQPHKRYLVDLGMPDKAIFFGFDVVGNATFHPDNIRGLPELNSKLYFLSINRFVPKKNLQFLISAYARYKQLKGLNTWDLMLCGDGYLRSQIEAQIIELGLVDCIHLPGFLQQNELLPYFAHAKCFIHASIQEQWGLVVNEAMAAGLPVLVSRSCGCFEDLILEGINGFGFDPEDEEELADLMLKISSDQADLKAMGQASLTHIQKFSPNCFAEGLIQAIEYARTHR